MAVRGVRRLGTRTWDVDDVTHHTFLRVYGALHEYDPSCPIRPWLFSFAFRVASDYRRLVRHREVLGEQPDLVDPALSPEIQVETRQSLEMVSQALGAPPLDRRAAFVLHVIDGCPMPTAEEALGVPLNTAYARLRLAREDFMAAMRRLQLRGRWP